MKNKKNLKECINPDKELETLIDVAIQDKNVANLTFFNDMKQMLEQEAIEKEKKQEEKKSNNQGGILLC